MEQKLVIETNGQHKNLNLKNLDNGNHVIVEKKYAETKLMEGTSGKTGKPYRFYTAKVMYDGQEVGIAVNDDTDAKLFNDCGGIGDKVKITCSKEIRKNKVGKDFVKTSFKFEPA